MRAYDKDVSQKLFEWELHKNGNGNKAWKRVEWQYGLSIQSGWEMPQSAGAVVRIGLVFGYSSYKYIAFATCL